MKVVNQVVDSIAKAVLGLSACTVFLVTLAQVINRFVLKSPLPWSQDVLRLAFTYLVFWGAAWCVHDKGHLNVDVVLAAMPEKTRLMVELVINMVLCAFFVFLILYGIQFAQSGLTQRAPYLPIPMTLYYSSIPTAAAWMLYYMVCIVAVQIKQLLGKKEGLK